MIPRSVGLLVGLTLAALAVALPVPQRPQRHRTNPERARQMAELQRTLAEAHAPPDAGVGQCDFEFGACFWWIGSLSTDTSGLPNDGVRITLSAVNLEPDGGCFDCWTSEYLDNGYWGQVGFSACGYQQGSQNNFTVFYQTWDADAGLLLVDGESTVITEGLHTFAMNLDAGTKWDYSVDGTIFGSYDMGSAAAAGPYAISTVCEEGDGVAAAFVPPTINVPATMQVDNGGQWTATNAGLVYNTAGLSGVDGNLQDATLANDQTVIGGSSAYLAPYTPLWTGSGSGALVDGGIAAVTPAYVAITAPAPNSTVSGTVVIAAEVACPAGSSVYFFGSDPSGPTCTLTAAPWTCSWDTTQFPDGTYYPLVEVQDTANNLTWADMTVTVNNSGNSSSSSGAISSGASSSTTTNASASSGASSSTKSASTSANGGSSSSGGPSSSRPTTGTTAPTSGSGASTQGSSSSSGGGLSSATSGPTPQRPAGCTCAAGTGSPAAVLPLFLLVAWLGRRRRV